MAGKQRGNGDGSIFFKESHNRWCAQVSTGNKNGKYTRKTIYGKTMTEVKEKMNKIKAHIELQSYCNSSKILIKDWLIEWLDTYKKNNVKKSTYTAYRNYIENTITPELGYIPLQKLNSFQVQTFLNKLIENMKSVSVKKVYLVLHASLKQAVINDLIVKSPCLGVTIPKDKNNPSKPATAFTIEQQKLIIENAHISSCKNEILLAIYTGMRVGEIISLYVSDIDFENKTININKNCIKYKDFDSTTSTTSRREISSTKTESSSRIIPFISDKVEQVIKDQIAKNNANKMLYGKCYKKTNLLFPSEKGELRTPQSLSTCFSRLCSIIEIRYNKGISPDNPKYVKLFSRVNAHMLRHSFATRCLEAGMHTAG
jgi:integrase